MEKGSLLNTIDLEKDKNIKIIKYLGEGRTC